MSKTITEIATDVLRKLGRLPDGQVAVNSHIQQIKDAYDELYQELANDSLVNWSSVDDIPDFAAQSVKLLLMGRVADNFGVPNQWLVLEELVKDKLAKQLSNPYIYQPTQFESF